jgi:two-component system chemotaxis response regulator CheB
VSKKIKLLLVDDSEVIIQILCAIFKDVKDIEVVGVAKNGLDAIEKTKKLHPDIITMDIEMPVMNGIEATQKIMTECPTPIVIISTHTDKDKPENAFEALKNGALTVFEKPNNILSDGFEMQQNRLRKLIRAMSEIKVVTRRPHLGQRRAKKVLPVIVPEVSASPKVIALGTSTGGPEAISQILETLSSLTLPLVIVLHIAENFLPGYISWLGKKTPYPILIATDNEILKSGHIYFAPDGRHLNIKNIGGNPTTLLTTKRNNQLFMPSVTELFESLALSYPSKVLAGLLTGMGKDGATGLLSLKKAGCLTFTQNKESSIIYGMPGRAKELNAAKLELDLSEIGPFLSGVMNIKEEDV